MDIKTKCIHGEYREHNSKGAVSIPIYQSATFEHEAVGQSSGYDYSRLQNPTRECLEKRITALEGGIDTVAFASGMAANSALMELFKPGDHVIASDDLYGGTIRLFDHISAKNGISVTYADTRRIRELEGCITDATKAIYIETPSNPMMQITDIRAAAQLAKKYHLLLIADNTFMTPYFCNPLALGADIVIHSGTKFLSGHNDTLAGFLTVNSEALAEKIRFLVKTVGSGLAPFDSWLLIRGIKTLALRLERQEANALAIAEWLSGHPQVTKVFYTGRPDHPGYEIQKVQCRGFGSMISFEVDREETAIRVLNSVRVITYAESLGGVESLMTYPMLQTHADVPAAERERRGIHERLLRLSVGIEAADDLIDDLKQAFSAREVSQ